MYQWKTLRTLAVLLLCLPLVHVTYLVTQGINTYLDASPHAWDRALQDIVARDLETPLPELPVLVVGGQRVRLWRDLPARLAPQPTLLRPLGDATLDDLAHHYDRLIAFYRPSVLVIVPSYADLHLRDEKSPQDFHDAARALLELDASYGLNHWRVLFVPLVTPLHPGDDRRIRAMARLADELSRQLPRVSVVNPNTLLTDEQGRADPAYFRSDGINLNDEGYARAALMLMEALREVDLDAAKNDKVN